MQASCAGHADVIRRPRRGRALHPLARTRREREAADILHRAAGPRPVPQKGRLFMSDRFHPLRTLAVAALAALSLGLPAAAQETGTPDDPRLIQPRILSNWEQIH